MCMQHFVYVCEIIKEMSPIPTFLIDIDTVGMIRQRTITSKLIKITICAYEFMKKKKCMKGTINGSCQNNVIHK